MKKFFLVFVASLFVVLQSRADEGMWLLPALQKMNAADMQAKGLKIDPAQIYSEDGASLKDAIVIFGGGCTGEIVSPDGLLFTNHHCGYGAIQKLSSVEHDYLKDGFWAMNRGQELHAEGLSVKFIRHMQDVTDRVLTGITDEMDYSVRTAAISDNANSVRDEIAAGYPAWMDISVKSFFGGNQYIAFVIEEYNDIRLVGTPPSSIGKFGGDTDNWMWPRHTGDFSIFRVYADAEGRPATYSPDNVPYKSPVHLKVSARGFEEGDFAMIMGFPGSTQRYMTSFEIDQMLEVSNPNRIRVRGIRQDILWEAMEADPAIKIKYANKYASSSNYWKNSIGMSRGVRKLGVRDSKSRGEEAFTAWVSADPVRQQKYSRALPNIQEAVEGMTYPAGVSQFISETLGRGLDIVTVARLETVLSNMDEVGDNEKAMIIDRAASFYKDYDADLERRVAKAMIPLLGNEYSRDELPSIYEQIDEDFNGNTDAYVDYLYDNSVFTTQERFEAYVNTGDYSQLSSDPAVLLANSVADASRKYRSELEPYNRLFEEGHRLYVAGLLEMEKDKMLYPDANFTIRLTYGNILPYNPADAVKYDFYTTLSGVMEKEDPTNSEFVVPARLKELYEARDFGPYEYKGDIPVGFISNNDITGGNSGSPVLNDRGELIGLAFDGNWEAMSGDIAFEPELQRCINVDVRYLLFIIDKFAGAGYLLDEMTIVR